MTKKYKSYKAILIGKDGFQKEMLIRHPLPNIFIPKLEKINIYLEEPQICSNPIIEHRRFVLKNKYKNKLQYQEF